MISSNVTFDHVRGGEVGVILRAERNEKSREKRRERAGFPLKISKLTVRLADRPSW